MVTSVFFFLFFFSPFFFFFFFFFFNQGKISSCNICVRCYANIYVEGIFVKSPNIILLYFLNHIFINYVRFILKLGLQDIIENLFYGVYKIQKENFTNPMKK